MDLIIKNINKSLRSLLHNVNLNFLGFSLSVSSIHKPETDDSL